MDILRSLVFSAFLLTCTFACKKQPTEFMRLDKLTFCYNHASYLAQREDVLIINPPNDTLILDSIMNDYIKKKSIIINIDSIDSISSSKKFIRDYFISFYRKSYSTKYFITHKEDKYHEIYDSKSWGSPDCLGWFFYRRTSPESKLWYSTYPKNFNDTIYSK